MSAPVNDNYLSSLELNGPHTALNDSQTLKDVRSTVGATVQTNILSPCGLARCPNGPAEVTSCQGINYGATICYDFYPQADGDVSIRTSGLPPRVPCRSSPTWAADVFGSNGTGLAGARLAMVKAGVAGSSRRAC